MRIAGLTTALVVVATALGTTPSASASATSFCTQLGGTWNGQYCHTTVQSDRDAVREISVAIPAELIDDPAVGPVLREYLTTLVGNWRTVGKRMVADSFGEGNYQVFRHGDALSLVYRETYHADGPDFNNAYRTFTFDMARGARLQLADLMKSGVDPLTAIPSLAHPYIVAALDAGSLWAAADRSLWRIDAQAPTFAEAAGPSASRSPRAQVATTRSAAARRWSGGTGDAACSNHVARRSWRG